MGVMKQLYLEELDAQDNDQPTVYVLTCNGNPCNAYMDKATADYEMWLCKQAAVHMDDKVEYALTEVTLSHPLD
jgi:hypothetical protein